MENLGNEAFFSYTGKFLQRDIVASYQSQEMGGSSGKPIAAPTSGILLVRGIMGLELWYLEP